MLYVAHIEAAQIRVPVQRLHLLLKFVVPEDNLIVFFLAAVCFCSEP